MAAGLGFKTFTTGEVLTAGDVNGYLMQGINVFATTTARNAAITAPQEGQFAFTKDTNSLWYYDGAAWVASGATGDIEGVTAGVGISGGGTSGTVTVTNSMATAIDAKGDLVPGTGADTFSRLAVGANGTVLTADSAEATGLKWATAAAAGTSWTLLNTGGTALTGATTITVSGISSKDKIMVIIPLASSVNANVSFKLRFNTDSGGNYYYYGNRMYATGTYSGSNFTGTRNYQEDAVYLGLSQNTNAYAYIAGGLLLNGGASSGIKSFTYTGGGVNIGYNSSEAVTQTGYYDSSSTISSVSIISTSGNFDDGSIFVYTSN